MRGAKKCSCDTPNWDEAPNVTYLRQMAGFQDWFHEIAEEMFRILKPGGHLLAFGGTRTYHRMACAIEDAGFEIRDSIHWIYGSGFPKSLDVSKAIDKAAGAEREVLSSFQRQGRSAGILGTPTEITRNITAPATPEAQQWQGWGTALKPAHEPIVVARKPLIGTVAANVLEHGTGALNIDGCRIGTDEVITNHSRSAEAAVSKGKYGDSAAQETHQTTGQALGRWPANIVLTHFPECRQTGEASDTYGGGAKVTSGFVDGYEGDGFQASTTNVPVYECAEDCPVTVMDEQSGERKAGGKVRGSEPSRTGDNGIYGEWGRVENEPFKDTGGASRYFYQAEPDELDGPPFFYTAKANKKERNSGVENANTHPTVKPVALMRYLVRLVTPPGGRVFDPFLGSGTTAVAAILEGMEWFGTEMTEEYYPIIEGRVAWAEEQMSSK
jgi:site-specific DNA-methyltransferase (adenine-specific)